MAIKVYISGISASQEVRKHQQRVLFILESLKIEHEVVDITEPDREEDKAFMREACSKHERANALPPQIFNGADYLGDYDDFEVATESDNLRAFLQLPPSKNGVHNGATEKKAQPDTINAAEGDIQA